MVSILGLLKDVAKIYFDVALLLQVRAYRETPVPLKLSFLDYLTYPMLKEIYAPPFRDFYREYERLLRDPNFVRETYSRKIDNNLDVWKEIYSEEAREEFPFAIFRIPWHKEKAMISFKIAIGREYWVLPYKKIEPLL